MKLQFNDTSYALGLVGLVCGFALPIVGQAAEDLITPEVIRQEQRLEELQRSLPDNDVRLQVSKDQPALKQSLVVDETPCFPIYTVALALENASSSEQSSDFLFALKDIKYGSQSILGHCVGTQGVRNIATAVQNQLIAKGYITTQAMIKPQDLNTGHLVISLYLGRVNQLLRTANTSPRVQLYSALPIEPDQILNLRDIEQGLENFRQLSGVNVDIQIKPATAQTIRQGNPINALEGYSDLVVSWEQRRRITGQIAVDDAGSESTGKYQANVGLGIENPLQINDVLNLNISHSLDHISEGNNKSYYAAYQVPYRQWLFSTFYSQYRYEQKIAGLNSPIIYSGISEQLNFGANRLISRGQNYKTHVQYRFYQKQVKSFIDDLEVGVQRRQTAGWQIGLNHRQFIGNSTLNLGMDYQKGTGAFQAMQAPEELFGEGKSRPTIWSADLNFNTPFQLFNQPLQYRLTWRGQWSPSALVPQDRFSIGGRYSVRGFNGEYTLAGDQGHLIQNEIAWGSWVPNSQLYFGVDQGWVNGPNTRFIAGKKLAGAVLGIRSYYQGLSLDAFAGRGFSAPRGIDKDLTGGFSLSFNY